MFIIKLSHEERHQKEKKFWKKNFIFYLKIKIEWIKELSIRPNNTTQQKNKTKKNQEKKHKRMKNKIKIKCHFKIKIKLFIH